MKGESVFYRKYINSFGAVEKYRICHYDLVWQFEAT